MEAFGEQVLAYKNAPALMSKDSLASRSFAERDAFVYAAERLPLPKPTRRWRRSQTH